MTYRVVVPPSVEKEIAALDRSVLGRVHRKIVGLEHAPRPAGVKKLAGGTYWRVRSGDYRVIFEIDDKARTVNLTRVRHRRDAYRGL